MKGKISRMYSSVFSNGNRCPCFEECKGKRNYHYRHSFICNANIKLGNDYGKGVPKIVIIGKEPKEKAETAQICSEPESFLYTTNQHYYRTKFILGALLGLINKKDFDNYEGNKISFCDEENIHKKFALTNHYHCAFKKDRKAHGVKTTETMWTNCAELVVREELKILEPDVVVIQAGWSVNAKKEKKDRERTVGHYFNKDWRIEECDDLIGLYTASNDTKKCIVIGSYHPCFAGWHKKENLNLLKLRISRAVQMLRSN